MPLSFAEVYNAYRNAGTEMSLRDFSQVANDMSQSQDYAAGDVGTLPGLIKKGVYWKDRALEATGLPEQTARFGKSVFEAAGADPTYGEEIGRSLPNSFLEFAPMAFGPIGVGVSSALLAADEYEKTGSPFQAAVGAATPLIGMAGGRLGINALAKTPFVSPVAKTFEEVSRAGNPVGRVVAQYFLEGAKDRTLGYMAQQAGALGAMELTNFASSEIANGVNPYEGRSLKDWALGVALGQLPYMIKDIPHALSHPTPVGKPETLAQRQPYDETPPLETTQISDQQSMLRRWDVDKQKAISEALSIKDPALYQQRLAEIERNDKFRRYMLTQPSWDDMPEVWASPEVQPLAKTLVEMAKNPWTTASHLTDPTLPHDPVTNPWTTATRLRPTITDNPWVPKLREAFAGLKPRDTESVVSDKDVSDVVTEGELAEKALHAVTETPLEVAAVAPQSELREAITDSNIASGESPEDAVVQATVGVRNDAVEKAKTVVNEEPPKRNRGMTSESKSKSEFYESIKAKPPTEMDQAEVNEVEAFLKKSSAKPHKIKNAWFNWRQQEALKPSEDRIESLRAALAMTANNEKRGKGNQSDRWEVDETGKPYAFERPAQALEKVQELNDKLPKDSPFEYRQYSHAGRNAPQEGKPVGIKRHYRNIDEKQLGEAERIREEVKPEAKAVVDVVTDKSEDPDAKAARAVAKQSLKFFIAKNAKELGIGEQGLQKIGAALKSGADPATLQAQLEHMLTVAKQKAEEAFFADREDEDIRVNMAGDTGWDTALHGAKRRVAPAGPGLEFGIDNLFDYNDKGQIQLGSVKIEGKYHPRVFPDGVLPENVFTDALYKSFQGPNQAEDWKARAKGEMELYKQLVPEAFVGGKVDVNKLTDGLEKHGPVVEVKKLGGWAQGVTGETDRARQIQHELETAGYQIVHDNESARLMKNGQDVFLDEVPPEVKQKYHDFVAEGFNPANDGGSQYAFVAPKAESDMSGYVEVLVRVPLNKEAQALRDKYKGSAVSVFDSEPRGKGDLFRGPHFGSEDTNVVSFFRGYMETLPNGKKVFHVIEVQSDWAQHHRKELEKDLKQYPGMSAERRKELEARGNHPLLSAYESLALKAAIKHAREAGADAIALSDAETAMMSEGHDIQREVAHGSYFTEAEAKADLPRIQEGHPGVNFVLAPFLNDRFTWKNASNEPVRPHQEKGMRLHYDQTLPKELARLTGDKGEVVDLGVHTKAIPDNSASLQEQLAAGTISQDYFNSRVKVKGSPVFRDAFGAPKSQITARLYPLPAETDFPLLGAKRRSSGSPSEPVENPKILPSTEKTIDKFLQLKGHNAEERRVFGRFLNEIVNMFGIPHLKLGLLRNKSDFGYHGQALGEEDRSLPRWVWLGTDKKQGVSSLDDPRSYATIIAHEFGHTIDFAVLNGFAPKRVQEAHGKYRQWLAENPDKALDFLKQWHQTLPEHYQKLDIWDSLFQTGADVAYAKRTDELYANTMALWSMSKMPSMEAKAWHLTSPVEAKGWIKTLTGYANRVLSSLRSAIFMRKGEFTPQFQETVNSVRELMDVTVNAVREAEVSMRTLAQWEKVGTDMQWMEEVDRMSDDNLHALLPAGVRGQRKEENGVLTKSLAAMFRTMNGLARQLPAFGRVNATVRRHASDIARFRNVAMAPVVGGVDPDTGTITTRGPEYKMWNMVQRETDAPLNELASDILQWKQRKEGTKFSVDELRNESPIWPPAGNVKKDLYQRFSAIPEAKKKAVQHVIAGLEAGHQEVAKQTIEAQHESGRNLMMLFLGRQLPKEMWHAAPDVVRKLTEAYDKTQSQDINESLQGGRELEAMRIRIGNDDTFQKALSMWADSKEGARRLEAFYAKKPGHMSLVRSGKLIARAYDAQGNEMSDGLQSMKEYDAWRTEMQKKGFVRFDEPQLITGDHGFTLSHEALDIVAAIEDRRKALIESMPVDDDVKQLLRENTNVSGDIARALAAKDLTKPGSFYKIQGGERRKVPGHMDMVDTQKLFFNIASRINANRMMRSRLAYELTNPELQRFPHEVQQFKRMVENYMRPDSDATRALARFNSVYMLGGNISSIIANGFQSFMTGIPEDINRGIGAFRSALLTAQAMKDVGAFTGRVVGERLGLYDDHKAIAKMKDADEREVFRRANKEGILSVSSLSELSDLNAEASIDLNRIAGGGKPFKPMEKALSVIDRFATFSMKGFAASEQFNKRVALLKGVRIAKETGVPKERWYDFAVDYMYATTYAGGRANRPLLQGDTGILGAAAYSLSSYTMGWLNQAFHYVSHWKGADYLNLSSAERGRARKAALTMMGIQLAAAGALGMPFIGAALKIGEKLTGENLTGDLYSLLGRLLDDDDAEGGGLSNIILNGAANAAASQAGADIDIGSKWSVNNVLGFNSYDGYNGDSVFGPTGQIVASTLAGLKGMAHGEFGEAAKQFSPAAIRKAVSYYVNGGRAETGQGSGVEMSPAETLGYLAGFNSQKLSALQKYRAIEKSQQDLNAEERRRETQEVLQLLDSSPLLARQKVVDIARKSDGLETTQQVARRVAEAAAQAAFPVDVRDTAGKQSGRYLMDVAKSLGVPLPVAAHSAKVQYVDNVMRMLGGKASRLTPRDVQIDNVGEAYTPFATVGRRSR